MTAQLPRRPGETPGGQDPETDPHDQPTRRAPLTAHAVAWAVVLAVLLVAIPVDASIGTDDGAYGGQVWALQQGDWVLERPLPVVAREHEGWFNGAIVADGPIPYSSNPSYAKVLQASADAVGWVGGQKPATAGDNGLGLRLVPALGAWASAVVAWLLASRWRRDAAPVAFWLVALGPTAVAATGLWAHTVTTATAGCAVLAAVVLLDRPGWGGATGAGLAATGAGLAATGAGPLAMLAAALAAGAALRTESSLWTVCFLAALTVARPARPTFLVAAVGGAAAGTTWLANRAWGLSIRADRLGIETKSDAILDSPGWLASRAPAGWELLLTTVRPGAGPLLLLAALALASSAALRLRAAWRDAARSTAPDRVTTALIAAAACCYGAAVVVVPGQLLAGTLTAWPLTFVLLIAGRWGSAQLRQPSRPEGTPSGWSARASATLLAGSSAAFAVAVLVTQYANSGGLQWGGRYLSMAIVPTAVAAALAGGDLLARHRVPLVALLVAPTLCGLAASQHLHWGNREVVQAVTAQPSEVVVTEASALPRVAWPALPTPFYRAEPNDLDVLLVQLAGADVVTVNVHGFVGVDIDGMGGYRVVGQDPAARVRYLRRG